MGVNRRRTKIPHPRLGATAGMALAALVVACAATAAAGGHATYGRVAGMVSDQRGTPLVGVTVSIIGPGLTRRVERVLTDAEGRFSAGDLLPGLYSLTVAGAAVVRTGVEVRPGQISQLSVIHSGIIPGIAPRSSQSVIRSGDNWKWVLRTAGSMRPVLRFQQDPKHPGAVGVDASQKLVAMIPGSAGGDALSDELDLGSVLAYWRPLAGDTDMLVASSVAGQGVSASSVATSFRRGVIDGNPQELTLVMHELNFSDGVQLLAPVGPANLLSARGMVLSYSQVRRLNSAIKVTGGFEVDYLNASSDAFVVQPQGEMEYRIGPSDRLEVRYGTANPQEAADTLAEKVTEINAFPRVSLRNNSARLETARHAEVAYTRRVTRGTHVELAAYHDGFSDAVVRGFGHASAWSAWSGTGNILPNAVGDGVNLDAGRYESGGFRVAVLQALPKGVEADIIYSTGDALAMSSAPRQVAGLNVDSIVEQRREESAAVRLSGSIPGSRTRVIASYAWEPAGCVTVVDPSGLAELNVAPYAGIQLRQPLPALAFLPGAHIQAVADFRNLAGEGYVRVAGSDGKPVILTPAYRSFSGGFSVQF
jgi:Carboxypeptidase regulatory-like domain